MKTTGREIDILLDDLEKSNNRIRDYFETVENKRINGRKQLTLLIRYNVSSAVILGPSARFFEDIWGSVNVPRDKVKAFESLGEVLGFDVVVVKEDK